MNTIVLNSIVNNASSNTEGVKLYNILKVYIQNNRVVLLNVDNETPMSSSFLNSSLGALIDDFGIVNLNSNLKLKATKSQFNRISNYIKKYSDIYAV